MTFGNQNQFQTTLSESHHEYQNWWPKVQLSSQNVVSYICDYVIPACGSTMSAFQFVGMDNYCYRVCSINRHKILFCHCRRIQTILEKTRQTLQLLSDPFSMFTIWLSVYHQLSRFHTGNSKYWIFNPICCCWCDKPLTQCQYEDSSLDLFQPHIIRHWF